MGKIDWLKTAEDYITKDSGKESVDAVVGQANALMAIACISLHNAEREQERQVVSIPPQPQPFDCEEVIRRLQKEDVPCWRSTLTSYVRSLGYPVKE